MNATPSRRRYPIPTHLTVEPSIVRTELGPIPVDLTFRQAAILAVTAGFLYWLWQGSGWPVALAGVATVAVVLLAAVIAFVTVGGRSADLWLRAVLHYLSRPRRLVWRAAPHAIDRPAAPVTRVGPLMSVAWAPRSLAASPDPVSAAD